MSRPGHPLLARGRGLLGADPVHRPAVGEGDHPGHRAPPGHVETGRVAPDLQQDFLGDFLGLGRVAQHAPRDAEHMPADPRVDRRERSVIPPPHLGEQGSQVVSGRAGLAMAQVTRAP